MNSLSKLKPLTPHLSNRINRLRFFSQNLVPIDPKKLPTNYDPLTFDPANHRAPPTQKVWSLVDDVSSLTLSEVSELSQILVQKLNLTNPPNIAIMGAGGGFGSNNNASVAGGGAGKEEEKKEEKTVFELKLEGFDAASKIKVIKEVRGFTDLGLKEAKELVEKAPVVIKGGVSKEDGEKIVEKMKAVGAKVVLA